MEATKINSSYIFALKLHVIAKHGNCSKKIAGKWKNNGLGVVINFQMEKHCLVKHFAFLKNFLLTIF